MSVMFLDELAIFGIHRPRSPPVKLSNIRERSTIPGPVGVLPLDHFIYILIGVLVFLCCGKALWILVKAMRSPKTFFESLRSQTGTFTASSYRERKRPPPGRVSAVARGEVGKLRTEPKYQADGFLDSSLAAKPNLPIPVVMEISNPERPGTGIDARDIEAWGNLVKEKESLNITIANLERLAQTRQQAGQQGTNPRLLGALQRRAEVENLINATYERFKERRAEWSAEEWQVIELIMRLKPR